MTDTHLSQLIRLIVGDKAADDLLATLQIERTLLVESAGAVSRGVFAMALNAVLFRDLLARVPMATAYVADRRRQGERIVLDHGALRTVRFPTGGTVALPPGVESFTRILEPMGYHVTGTHPVERLRMTGYALTHREFPETLPQFFVSELHIERFSKEFQAAAQRVFAGTGDSLGSAANGVLANFAERGRCEMKLAAPSLREIAAAFGRRHEMPTLSDYRTLLAESAECAWIATEGFALNHAGDRVDDVAMTACAQRSLGRPMKRSIETSASGTVRQTAFRADPVRRALRADDGSEVETSVPGPFYEFISRNLVTGPDGRKHLDLRFEGGTQGVFRKTANG